MFILKQFFYCVSFHTSQVKLSTDSLVYFVTGMIDNKHLEICTKEKQKDCLQHENQHFFQHENAMVWPKYVSESVNKYWDFMTTTTTTTTNCSDSDNDEKDSPRHLTYESLGLICAGMVHFLRQKMKDGQSSIVVAIPEGPYLPLAILAIHVLNEPKINMQHINHNETPIPSYTVLIPLDPNEGAERIKRTLQEIKPDMIVALPGKDTEMFITILNTLTWKKTKNREKLAQMINVTEWVRDIIESIHHFDRAKISVHKHSSDSFVATILCWEQLLFHQQQQLQQQQQQPIELSNKNRLSHICFTSGSTGIPKGCMSSSHALKHYIHVKNQAHAITHHSRVLLASALSFDPCLSDILATWYARATLVLVSRHDTIRELGTILRRMAVTHILATPTVWGTLMTDVTPVTVPDLQVVALGGEPISKRIVAQWARSRTDSQDTTYQRQRQYPRLYATYGVTEACVYQTIGEIFQEDEELNVGTCFDGLHVTIQGATDDKDGESGEVILSGKQLDQPCGYLNQPESTKEKFYKENGEWHYKTGDIGYVKYGKLHILGRIQGEEGMVKVNGVRVELGEVEAALEDSLVVSDCLAVVKRNKEEGSNQIHAFIILTTLCLSQFNLERDIIPETGVICSTGPLLMLLRAKCRLLVRAAVIPSMFILIPRVPLSPTGKCDRRKLPQLTACMTMENLQGTTTVPLWDYGVSGAVVAEQVMECLNLQGCQKDMLTTTANFAMLGGDSLGSTRVVRALYAFHHGVPNTRDLGGSLGALDGPFAVTLLLRCKSMQEYVDWLDQNGVCGPQNGAYQGGIINHQHANDTSNNQSPLNSNVVKDETIRLEAELYDALLETITLSQFSLALELLNVGADPNFGAHGGRLSKTSHRIDRRKKFTSNPLHLACSQGHVPLVKKLLERKCKFNAPDASGMFPIHMAASGKSASNGISPQQDDLARRICLELLLDAGAPLSMKDGSQQTLLHCAARAGHVECLTFLLCRWKQGLLDGTVYSYTDKHKGGEYDWTDHWYRTPVHWAVLNGKAEALSVLLAGGCSAEPGMLSKKKCNHRTSAELESPLEVCERQYGGTLLGESMRAILLLWKERQSEASLEPNALVGGVTDGT